MLASRARFCIGVDSIEEKLECAVGLGAKVDLRAKQEDVSAAHFRGHGGDTVFEKCLPPGPTATECIRAKPGDWLNAFGSGIWAESKHRAVAKEKVGCFIHAPGQWVVVVDGNLKDRPRDVKTVAAEILNAAGGATLDKMVLDREIEVVREIRRAVSDSDYRAAVLNELAQ
tara:strand:+ start:1768 stop:2280 length:513 start_codon:yes stop_codon:yes gene_type:complete